MKFGEKLKKLREEKHMTQSEVVSAMGINPATNKSYLTLRAYMAYEQKNVRPRHREIYDKLAEVLECDKDYLLSDGDPNSTMAFISGLAAMAFVPIVGISFPAVGAIAASSGLSILGSGALKATKFILGAGVTKGLFNSIIKNSETKENKVKKAKELILKIENNQKSFSADALRIIQNYLSKNKINYRLADINNEKYDATKTDDILLIDTDNIKEWWLTYWAKNEFDKKSIYEDLAKMFMVNYATLGINENRKISIVVDDDDIYEAIVSQKNKIGLNINLTTLLIDRENRIIENEDVIATCKEKNENEIILANN